MEVIRLKLEAKPFAGGIEWRWTDKENREYDLGQHGDMEFDLTKDELRDMGTNKARYLAIVTMQVPFRWVNNGA